MWLRNAVVSSHIYGVMADTIVISEVLCFMFSKFGKFTKMQMKSTLLGFYAETELDAAKDQLFGDSAKLNLDDRPRNVKRIAIGATTEFVLLSMIYSTYALTSMKRAVFRAFRPMWHAALIVCH